MASRSAPAGQSFDVTHGDPAVARANRSPISRLRPVAVAALRVIGFGALFLFWVKRMRAGKLWARMLLTVIGSFIVFTTILDLFAIASSAGAMDVVMSVLSIGQGVLAAGAIYLMHRRESNEYFFASRKQ